MLGDQLERIFGPIPITSIVSKGGQPEQCLTGERVSRRCGIVLQVLGAQQELFTIPGCVEEAAVRIFEQVDHFLRKLLGRGEPPILKICLVQLEQAQDQRRIIFQKDVVRCLALSPASLEPAVRTQGIQQEIGITCSHYEIFMLELGFIDRSCSFRRGGQHQSIPGGQDFIVSAGADTRGARRQQPGVAFS